MSHDMSEDDARAALAHRAAQGRRKRLRKALAKGRKPVPAVHPDEKRDCSLCGNSFGLITDRGVCRRRWPSLPAARECLTSSGGVLFWQQLCWCCGDYYCGQCMGSDRAVPPFG